MVEGLFNLRNEKGIKLPGNPYGYSRAFTKGPSDADIKNMESLLQLMGITES